MAKTESFDPDCSLADLPVGSSARIVAVGGDDVERLMTLGFRPGPIVTVEQDAPFRGPRIVRVGGTRMALARSVARAIRVTRSEAGGPVGR
jgi:Fe2+ transport system protein FeoA